MKQARTSERRIAVVTGTRAEFGLLRPIMDAVAAHPRLELLVIAAGAHLLRPGRTIREVEAAYNVAATVPMQKQGVTGRGADAAALGRGVSGFAEALARLTPDVVLVLGDRIEAFAAASAASVGGITLGHIHGGDRAEGVADEAMRHAISKLAHLHFPATAKSAQRLRRMGESAERIYQVGSPAIDGLAEVLTLEDGQLAALGIEAGNEPIAVVLHHPAGLAQEVERETAQRLMRAVLGAFDRGRVLALEPNHDPGREAVIEGLIGGGAGELHMGLVRGDFVGLLKRVAASGGLIIGNSSAGLIEAAALGCVCLNVGPRQRGRERGETVITCGERTIASEGSLRRGLKRGLELARELRSKPPAHPYGEGRAGERIAGALAEIELGPALMRKCNDY